MSEKVRERDRERERETEREKQGERETNREREREKERETVREEEREGGTKEGEGGRMKLLLLVQNLLRFLFSTSISTSKVLQFSEVTFKRTFVFRCFIFVSVSI